VSERERIAECFAGNLLKLRRQAGLSQEELARRAGLHRTEVSYLETCRRIPRIDTLVKVGDSLDARPDQLLEEVEWLWDQQRFLTGRIR
jgi:transcriptional regulator with XRE-family HTH domain